MSRIYILFYMVLSGVLRAQTPGTLNTSFSENGWDSLSIHNNGYEVNSMVVQPDGKLLICSQATLSDAGHEASLVRYNPNGTPDNTFGSGNGIVKTFSDYGANFSTRAKDMALQSDGKILIVGDHQYKTERIIRLHNDGSIDGSYGNGSMVEFLPLFSEYIYHCGLQSDNKLIVSGTKRTTINGHLEHAVFIWRLTENGELDTTFGESGEILFTHPDWTGMGDHMIINEMTIMSNDEILVNLSSPSPDMLNLIFLKYSENGNPVADWGENGVNLLNFGPRIFSANYSSQTLLRDGSIAFTLAVPDENSRHQTRLFKLLPDGHLDASFGNPSIGPTVNYSVIHPLVSSGDRIYCIWYSDYTDFAEIYAFTAKGLPDVAFGENGVTVIDQNGMFQGTVQWAATCTDGELYFSQVSNPQAGSETQILTVIDVSIPQNSLATANDHSIMRELTIFSNPTQNSITAENHSGQILHISDMSGRLVKKILPEDSGSLEIDLSDLPNGSYYLTDSISKQTGKFTKK